MKALLLILATALLTACASAPPRSVPASWPALDASLAAPCVLPDAPPAALTDYDARDGYFQHSVLPSFADCAQRKARLVEAWERGRNAPASTTPR